MQIFGRCWKRRGDVRAKNKWMTQGMFFWTSNKTWLPLLKCCKKHGSAMAAGGFGFTIGKFLKVIIGWDKMQTECEKQKRRATTWHSLYRKGNGWIHNVDGYTIWMKREAFYTSVHACGRK